MTLSVRNKIWDSFPKGLKKKSLETNRYVSLMKEKQKEKDKSMQLTSLNGWIVHSPHQNWTLERAQNKRWILNNKILEKRNRLRKSRYSLNGENWSCILSVLILRNPKLGNNDAHKIPKWQRFWNILFPCLFFIPLFFSLSTTIKPVRGK